MYKKLFIPGPTHVRDEILEAQTAPMLGHRSTDYSDLQAKVTPKLQQLLYTEQPVFIYSASGTGVMEGSIRQTVLKRALITVCGAFSKRWHEIAVANGVPCDKIEVPMGEGFTADMIDEALAQGDYDVLTVTLNETSTGVMNPLQDIAAMVREKYPNMVILVDAVSAMGGVKIEVDAWDVDVVISSSQKCFALPPGLAVTAVSERAIERAKQVPNRGYYFDFVDMYKYYQRNQTPATPAISLIQALNQQMDDILAQGLEARWERHIAMAQTVQAWARQYWSLFPNENFLSNTVTTINNTRGVSISDLNKELAKRGAMLSNGYGGLKEQTFRIAHMGDLTVEDIQWLLGMINEILDLA